MLAALWKFSAVEFLFAVMDDQLPPKHRFLMGDVHVFVCADIPPGLYHLP